MKVIALFTMAALLLMSSCGTSPTGESEFRTVAKSALGAVGVAEPPRRP